MRSPLMWIYGCCVMLVVVLTSIVLVLHLARSAIDPSSVSVYWVFKTWLAECLVLCCGIFIVLYHVIRCPNCGKSARCPKCRQRVHKIKS